MKKFLFLSLSVAAASSQALLVDPTGGAVVGTGDDSVFARTLGGNFQFYGVQHSSVNVSTNGNLQFLTSTNAWTNTTFPNATVNMIAPFWDDLNVAVGGGNSLVHNSTASYDAFTWDTTFFSAGVGRIRMQALLARTNFSIGIANFAPGDIAFSYDAPVNGTVLASGTVGLNEGTVGGGANRFVYATGHSNAASTKGMLPDHLSTGLFYLFGKGANGYTAELVVPEPGTFLAIGIGLAGLALVRRRK